jgi:Pectate lyase superfamily protein
MTAQLAPLGVQKFFDNSGQPLALGLVYTYQAGSTIPQATYTDSTQTTQNTNPIQLNARGECAMWLDPTLGYKINVTDQAGNQLPGWPVDNIPGGFGSLPISVSLIPNPTNTFTLGNSTHSWAQVYLGPNAAPAYDSVTGNIGYIARTPAEIAAGVTPVNFAYPPGDVRRYGGDPTGVADSTAALQAMISQHQSGGAVPTLVGGTYLCSQILTLNYDGWRLQGTTWDTCQIKFTATLAAGIVIHGSYGRMEGVYVNGNSKVTNGIVCWKAAGCTIMACSAQHCLTDGLQFNLNYSTPAGTNDDCVVIQGLYNSNGRHGIAIPVNQGDNNVLQFINVIASGNTSNGMLLKGLANQVLGGDFEGNGGYGIQLSDNTDAGNFTQNCLIWFPWIEANTAGGIRGGGNSVNNTIMLGSQVQLYTAASGSIDMFLQCGSSNGPELTLGDGTDNLVLQMLNQGGVGPRNGFLTVNGADTNIPIYVGSKGTGGVWLAPFAGDRLSCFGATAVAQGSTGSASATFAANSGTAINTASTFDGYTLQQVVKILRLYGLLA